MAKLTKNEEKDPQREREDEVLRRLLKTPPKPHKPTGEKPTKKTPDK